MFRFTLEGSIGSLRDFGPLGKIVGLFLYEEFLKVDVLACVQT